MPSRYIGLTTPLLRLIGVQTVFNPFRRIGFNVKADTVQIRFIPNDVLMEVSLP